jgi:hypothetical protein
MPFYTGHIAAASNRADLLFQVQLIDPVTNDFVDLTGAKITVALRPVSGGNNFAAASMQRLTGTNQDGHITVLSPGLFEVHFTRQEMTQFSAGDLDIGITVLLASGITYQLVAGQLPVVDGVVAA